MKDHEFINRQKFIVHNSSKSRAASPISAPPQHSVTKNIDLRDFIHEQRKIISSFRSQPWPMRMKMEAIKNYKENVLRYVPQLNTIDTFRDKSSQAVLKEKEKIKRFSSSITIWRSIIKKIEGNFGTSVGSYFRLVRWLCLLNFLLFLLTFLFLTLPQLIAGKGLPVPAYVKGNVSLLSFVVDGEGYAFEYSILFYGYYDSGQNETYIAPPFNPDPYIGAGYKLPLAYLLVILAIFVITGAAILYSIAKKLKGVQRSKVGGEGLYTFAWKIFASWDYAITDPKRAKSKMKQNGISLKESLFEASKTEDNSTRAKWKKLVRHIVTNSIVTVLLIGTGYAIFLAAENANREGNNASSFTLTNIGFDTIVNFFRAFQLQMVILLRNFLTPIFFKFVALQERFHPRTALKLRLLRLFVLYFSSLYVVMISLFILSRGCANNEDDLNCRCWETNIGQEMYKLMLIQTLAEVGSILFVEGTHWAFTKVSYRMCRHMAIKINKLIGNIEFEISVNVLKLVYGQGLILIGVLFCPFLPAIGFVRNIGVFYLRTMAVFVFDKPPTAFFHVASTHAFYMAILLVTVFLSSLPVGFAMVVMRPSRTCGPFRGLENMFRLLVNEIDTWPDTVQAVVNYIQTPTIVIPIITLLCIIIYYYVALGNALKKVNEGLALQLKVEQNETRKIIAENVMNENIAGQIEKMRMTNTMTRSSIGSTQLMPSIGGAGRLRYASINSLIGPGKDLVNYMGGGRSVRSASVRSGSVRSGSRSSEPKGQKSPRGSKEMAGGAGRRGSPSKTQAKKTQQSPVEKKVKLKEEIPEKAERKGKTARLSREVSESWGEASQATNISESEDEDSIISSSSVVIDLPPSPRKKSSHHKK